MEDEGKFGGFLLMRAGQKMIEVMRHNEVPGSSWMKKSHYRLL